MLSIPVVVGSVRRGRMSPRVAAFVQRKLVETGAVESPLLDLAEYDFPPMEERFGHRDDPPAGLAEFAATVAAADGLVIVSPEYNRSYPGVLKNALDYLWAEFNRKPFGLVTVSSGGFGGVSCMGQLQLLALGLGAFPMPANLPVSNVEESFAEDGTPNDASWEARGAYFAAELVWYATALSEHKRRVPPPKRG